MFKTLWKTNNLWKIPYRKLWYMLLTNLKGKLWWRSKMILTSLQQWGWKWACFRHVTIFNTCPIADFFFLKVWVETWSNRTWLNFMDTRVTSLHFLFFNETSCFSPCYVAETSRLPQQLRSELLNINFPCNSVGLFVLGNVGWGTVLWKWLRQCSVGARKP